MSCARARTMSTAAPGDDAGGGPRCSWLGRWRSRSRTRTSRCTPASPPPSPRRRPPGGRPSRSWPGTPAGTSRTTAPSSPRPSPGSGSGDRRSRGSSSPAGSPTAAGSRWPAATSSAASSRPRCTPSWCRPAWPVNDAPVTEVSPLTDPQQVLAWAGRGSTGHVYAVVLSRPGPVRFELSPAVPLRRERRAATGSGPPSTPRTASWWSTSAATSTRSSRCAPAGPGSSRSPELVRVAGVAGSSPVPPRPVLQVKGSRPRATTGPDPELLVAGLRESAVARSPSWVTARLRVLWSGAPWKQRRLALVLVTRPDGTAAAGAGRPAGDTEFPAGVRALPVGAPDVTPWLLEPFTPQDPTFVLCPTGAGTLVYQPARAAGPAAARWGPAGRWWWSSRAPARRAPAARWSPCWTARAGATDDDAARARHRRPVRRRVARSSTGVRAAPPAAAARAGRAGDSRVANRTPTATTSGAGHRVEQVVVGGARRRRGSCRPGRRRASSRTQRRVPAVTDDPGDPDRPADVQRRHRGQLVGEGTQPARRAGVAAPPADARRWTRGCRRSPAASAAGPSAAG